MSMTQHQSVCVFCGSSNVAPQEYYDLAARVGTALAARNVRLVNGGGGVGLMGASARACRAAGGQTFGVIPTFLRELEVADKGGVIVEVATMHERKAIMFDKSDAFLILPGGIGTLEEAVEVLSWRRLRLHAKPIVFLSENGFWDPFFTLLRHTVEARFTSAELAADLHSCSSVEAALDHCLAQKAAA
jgi:uncharacterized protein (TIGR00730 family)